MASSTSVRNGLLVGIMVMAQCFWLFTTFAYSEEGISINFNHSVGEVGRIGTVGGVANVPSPPPPMTAVPSAASGSSVQVSFTEVGGTVDPAIPSTPASGGGDLGAQIKYCIVFPLLNSAGNPIPNFNVPACSSTSTPPTPAQPRLSVVKVVVNNNGGTATTSNFILFVGSTQVTSGVSRIFSPGTYTISESTTTVTIGTTTVQYLQSISGDCSSSGSVTLALGDNKVCTITNDDPGSGSTGGNGGNSGNGGSGSTDNGGSSGGNSGGSSGGSSSGFGPGGYSPPGQILGTTTPPSPDYMGGDNPEPGVPNAGSGGNASDTLGLLVFSLMASFLSLFLLRMSLKARP